MGLLSFELLGAIFLDAVSSPLPDTRTQRLGFLFSTQSMHIAFEICRVLSAIAFIGYGISCIATQHMVAEFERFGLSRFRQLVGALELLGGLGLLVAYFYPPLLLLASGGLTLLMLLGVWTRIRIRDSVLESLPAFAFFVLNGFVFWYAASGHPTPS